MTPATEASKASPATATTAIVLVAVGYEFVHGFFHDKVNDFASTLTVHEVAHEDAALVNEQVADGFILQHILQQTGGRLGEGPCITTVIASVVKQLNSVVVVLSVIKSESEVGILDNHTESLGQFRFRVVIVGAPQYGVVAWPVDIAIEEVHSCYVQVFADIQPLLVFCQSVALLAIELLEGFIEINGAFLQFFNELIYIINLLM